MTNILDNLLLKISEIFNLKKSIGRVKVEDKVVSIDGEIEQVKKSISQESSRAVDRLSRVQRQLHDLEALIIKH